jgi:hypothetical protein
MIVRRRGLRSGRRIHTVEVISADEVGDDFDDLWRRRLGESQRLLADRSATTPLALRGLQKGSIRPRCFAFVEKSPLVGYAAVVRRDLPHVGLTRAYLTDIFVERDDPQTIQLLLAATVRQARADGAAESPRLQSESVSPIRAEERVLAFFY